MYLGIDVGGTKTLVASLNDEGVIQEEYKFPTPKLYSDFLKQLAENVARLSTKTFHAAGIGIPAMIIDRAAGVGVNFPNLPWRNVRIKNDLTTLLHCSVVVENDAKMAALSESQLEKDKRKVLCIVIGTGIGTALVVDGAIDTELGDAGGKGMLLEHNGKLEAWEDFASGRVIFQQFGKKASEIEDEATWRVIAHNLMPGFVDLIALTEPDIVIVGGGIGTYFSKYGDFLVAEIKRYANPLLTIPQIKAAERPEKAVVYGCYDLARATYGKAITVA